MIFWSPHLSYFNDIAESQLDRILKADLDIRPVYHKINETSKVRIHLGLPGW